MYILTYEQKKGKKKKASPNKAAAKPTKRPAFAKQPADAEAKRRRRGRGFDERLSDARMADLDEVSKRLRKRLQFLAAQRDKRGRGRWRRRHTSPAAASSAGQRGKRGRGHWRRRDRWPAAASSEELAAGSESRLQDGQPPGHVALMLQAPGEAAGSFLMAPGEVFASLAVAVVDAHLRATMRRRAQAWVRLRELVRKAASRRFAWFGSALWLQAFDSRRRREAGDEPAMTVRLTHPEAMGREWGVDIAVYPSETAGSVRDYALGILACGELIPGARARRWTSARIRKEALAGHKMIKVTVGGQDVALDLSRTLAQSGIRPGSTLKLKSAGLLGGMPTGHPETAARAPAQSAAPATATPLDADAQGPPEPGPSEHLDGAARALVRAEGLASRLAGDLARIFALAPSGSDPGDHDLRKDLATDAAASDASSPPDHRAERTR